jgi:hypothetical protein
VRLGDWKLIGNTRDTSRSDGRSDRVENFLVNLKADPAESRNLVDQHPDIVANLRRLHEEHLR